MISSNNQYLRPEYLSPLPTTLDAKKSPLALLAQTCSQIGADTPNSKLLSGADKKPKSESAKSKSDSPSTKISNTSTSSSTPTSNSTPTTFKPYETTTLTSSSSSSSASVSHREKSKTPEERLNRRTPKSNSNRCGSNQSATSRESPSERKSSTPNHQSSNHQSKHDEERITPSKESTSPPKVEVKDYRIPTSTYLGYPPGIPLGMDLMSSGLMNPHLKSSLPYLNYRMKSPSEMPICRDPYCTGCGLSSHLPPKTSCPAGCTQCDHATSKSYLPPSPAAAAYAHAQLAALAAASHLPYVCSWISGDAQYCGKRFSSSEELLTHLRTHTSASDSALSMLSPGLPPSHPLLHRTYPTPPLSPLATARYHPYSKPSLLPPSLSSPLGSYPLPPGLSPYFSPYSLYPRLGATPGMHP